jgi:hypothetical protein
MIFKMIIDLIEFEHDSFDESDRNDSDQMIPCDSYCSSDKIYE